MIRSLLAIAAAALIAGPGLAQATGPQGLAEPKAPTVKPEKVKKSKKVKAQKVDKVAKGMKTAAPVVSTKAPPPTPENTLNIELGSGGTVSIQLRPDKAPLAVERLKILAGRGFYNGLTFHRVIDGFMAQGGDPKGDGSGGSDLPDLKAEFNDLPHVRGAMAMARAAGEDSANSQFYIVTSPTLQLDNHYTVVGRVFQGMAYVDKIEQGEPPANPTKMIRVYIGAAPANSATPPLPPPPPPAAALPDPSKAPPSGKAPAKAAPKLRY